MKGLVIVWIAVGFSSYEETDIAEYQAANDPSRPLNALSESEIDFELVKIAKAIDRILDANEHNGSENATAAPESETEELSVETGALTAKDDAVRKRIYEALADGKWAWRTVDALAAKAALPLEDTIDILRRDPEIIFGRGKTGKQIARLRSRLP